MTVSRADLDWWWSLAREVRWTWASTYANSAPHWYVVCGKVRGMGLEDFLKVGELIRTYGTPGKFYSYTNLYLINPEGTHKVWCMWSDDPDGDDVHGINLARTDRTYGPQTFTTADVARMQQLRLPPLD
ncbi:MAG TPA: hypothetical protein VHA79_09810 [Mycobacteriales bacterium]|nr:hypothetical protein [Mycobacteriales bacterium]